MTITSTILRNIKFLTLAQIVASVAGLLSFAWLARVLGADGFGVLGFGTAFLSLLGVFASLSSDMYGAREIAREPNEAGSISSPIIGLRLILSILAYFIFVVVVLVLDRTQTEKTVLLIQGSGVFIAVFTLDFVFQGLERMGINGLRQIFTALLTLACLFIFVNSIDDLVNAAIIPVVAGGLAVLAIWVYGKKNIPQLRLEFSSSKWRKILVVALPMAFTGVMHTIIFNTDVVMLGLMTDNIQTGLYASAFKIVLLTTVPAGLLIAPFFPTLSAGWKELELRIERSRSFAISVLIVGLPLLVFIGQFSNEVIRVLYGGEYLPAAEVLTLLMIGVGVLHFRIIYGNPLLAWNAEKSYMVAMLVGTVLNILLNYFLIPIYGINGAAYASIVSQVFIAVGVGINFYKQTQTLHSSLALRVLFCCVLAFVVTNFADIRLGISFVDGVLALTFNGLIFIAVYIVSIVFMFKQTLKSVLGPQ